MQATTPAANTIAANINQTGYYSNTKPEADTADVEAAIAVFAKDKEDIAEFGYNDGGQNAYKQNADFTSGVKSSSSFADPTSKPQDNSSQLTARLVAATGQFEVRQVTAEANTTLVKLRMYAGAATGKDKETAEAGIRKLEKLLNRANRKIKDLDKEDTMKLYQARAEKEKKNKLAEEIKSELRKQKILRKQREQNYLIEDMYDRLGSKPDSVDQLDSASEAEIAIQAEAMAAFDVSVGADSGVGGEAASASLDVSVGVDTGGGEEAAPAISIEA